MGLFRRTRAPKSVAVAEQATTAAPVLTAETAAPTGAAQPAKTDELFEDSDVFVCARDEEGVPADRAAPDANAAVTLFVTGWHNVEPGPLSWPFPNMRAALDAVRKMKNAIEWAIVLGGGYETLEQARETGTVLIEQQG